MTRSIRLLLAALTTTVLVCSAAQAQDKPAPKPADPPKATQPEKKADQPKTDKKPDAKDEKPAEAKDTSEYEYIKIDTNKGVMFARLDKTKAPISTKNFMAYVDKKFYDNTIFHRVVKDFVIQGGGYSEDLKEKATDAPIKNEWKNGLKNKRGTLAMARQPAADSASSQFYINVKDNDLLDMPREAGDNAAYAVFGNIVAGMNVVDQIRQVRTTTKTGSRPDGKPMPLGDCPTENVVIKSIAKATKDEADKAAAAEK